MEGTAYAMIEQAFPTVLLVLCIALIVSLVKLKRYEERRAEAWRKIAFALFDMELEHRKQLEELDPNGGHEGGVEQ